MTVYEKLGVRKVINAQGTMSYLGSSLMPPEVVEAWVSASKAFVHMDELNAKVGELIAALTGAEYGCVTAGADAGLSLAVAACMAGSDPEKYHRLPDTTGMRDEVIIPRMCTNIHNRAFTVSGAKLVFIGDEKGFAEEDIERAIGDRTVAIAFVFFTNTNRGEGALAKAIKVAKRRGLPIIVDAAAETPPRENIRKLIAMGADLVAFSGGKDIRGPGDTGILFGRRDLIEAVLLQMRLLPPFGIGRSMKVGKEDVAATAVALERYMALDMETVRASWERRAKSFIEEFGRVPHVQARLHYPDASKGEYTAQCWPTVRLTIDERALGVTAAQVAEALRHGSPPIYVWGGSGVIGVNPHCLLDGEEVIVARRLRAVLKEVAKA